MVPIAEGAHVGGVEQLLDFWMTTYRSVQNRYAQQHAEQPISGTILVQITHIAVIMHGVGVVGREIGVRWSRFYELVRRMTGYMGRIAGVLEKIEE